VSNDVKSSLEQINEVSRQLLSQILTLQNTDHDNANTSPPSYTIKSVTEYSLAELMSKRERLIHLLFKQKTTEEIANESALLNELISLDAELSNKSQEGKKILAEQVMKFKKSKKASKSYQKY
jgi:hypothetical protein